jgi:hypothetical protein
MEADLINAFCRAGRVHTPMPVGARALAALSGEHDD